ncbi:MAG: hypothetical protein ACI86H_001560, partial [bacterium]
MGASIWHQDACGPGRGFQLAKNVHIKYDDAETIISRIVEGLKQYIKIECAVRFTVDSPISESERAIIALPYQSQEDLLLFNLATLIFQNMKSYYNSADPKNSHFGYANAVIEGDMNSLFRRELESVLLQCQHRPDMAGQLLRSLEFVADDAPAVGENYMQDTLKEGLDIHVGYRLVTYSKEINRMNIFIPVEAGSEVIDRVYYNLEQIIQQNFIAYDETGEGYLKVTDTLIFKELVQTLRRAKQKENTRKKIINDLVFSTIFTNDPSELYGEKIGDNFYDTLNKVHQDYMRYHTDRSRELVSAGMIRTTEITHNGTEVETLHMEDSGKTYVPEKPDEHESLRVPEREDESDEDELE